jgi:multicomponent Na+:H+ antiporter subunit E
MDAGKKWQLFRIALTWLFLFLLWFLYSTRVNSYSVVSGSVASLFMAILSYDVFIEKFEAGRRSVIPRLFPALIFIVRVVFAMYVSSFRVLRAVFSGGEPLLAGSGRIHPRVVHFRTRLHADLARVVLAHSITFTPGTITLGLDDDHYIVHWLFATTGHSAQAGEEIKGSLEKGIRRIWS